MCVELSRCSIYAGTFEKHYTIFYVCFKNLFLCVSLCSNTFLIFIFVAVSVLICKYTLQKYICTHYFVKIGGFSSGACSTVLHMFPVAYHILHSIVPELRTLYYLHI